MVTNDYRLAPGPPPAVQLPLPNWSLPLHLIWRGFAVNTLFYAVVIALLYPGPAVIRCIIRRRRGLCPQCGFDGWSALEGGCPECGWQGEPQTAETAT